MLARTIELFGSPLALHGECVEEGGRSKDIGGKERRKEKLLALTQLDYCTFTKVHVQHGVGDEDLFIMS